MFLINEFKTIFSEALERFAKENEIGKSKNTILIFPDNDTDKMQLQFAYCIETDEGYQPVSLIAWSTIFGGDDFIMNRNMMMATFFHQAFIRLARENNCPMTDIGIMVIFENDDSEELMFFPYNKTKLLTDIETKLKRVILIDEVFMDVTE